ncbi:MAG: NFACT RNA binding domain-containing protein [Candidatus Micrarchaeota archaeon]
MKGQIELNIGKTVHENASSYYEKAKELKKKSQSAGKAIEDTKKAIASEVVESAVAIPKKAVRVKREKKWFERFHWFETGGYMVLAGRDAKQNEELVWKHLSEEDYFFHADIRGAPATILKNGKKAPETILTETAQFAASYSSAWKAGIASVDVYCVEKSQVSKEAQGEYLGTGSFVISGKRTWFRNTPLGLKIGVDETGNVHCAPESATFAFFKSLKVKLGPKEKGEAAREIAKELCASVDEVLSALPAGKFGYEKN